MGILVSYDTDSGLTARSCPSFNEAKSMCEDLWSVDTAEVSFDGNQAKLFAKKGEYAWYDALYIEWVIP